MAQKILIIEDEQTLARSLKAKMERAGYAVDRKIDGVHGLKHATDKKPDFIILDLILPGMGGLEVLNALKSKKETKIIPVLVLSNVDDPKSSDEALNLGAVNYLIKTQVTLENILEEIRKHI
ncbi:MAG: response regulator [bacterium]|nr:response regulator [bacterium]